MPVHKSTVSKVTQLHFIHNQIMHPLSNNPSHLLGSVDWKVGTGFYMQTQEDLRRRKKTTPKASPDVFKWLSIIQHQRLWCVRCVSVVQRLQCGVCMHVKEWKTQPIRAWQHIPLSRSALLMLVPWLVYFMTACCLPTQSPLRRIQVDVRLELTKHCSVLNLGSVTLIFACSLGRSLVRSAKVIPRVHFLELYNSIILILFLCAIGYLETSHLSDESHLADVNAYPSRSNE